MNYVNYNTEETLRQILSEKAEQWKCQIILMIHDLTSLSHMVVSYSGC